MRLTSSLGRKYVMALSGVLLLGFVVAHLAGNLLVFAGPEALNAYAKKLRLLGPGLWAARLGLLGLAAVHVVTSIQLAIENRRARPQPYAVVRHSASTLAGRTMVLSGLLVLAYLVYHLAHFTWQTAHPAVAHLTDSSGRHDVYRMVVLSFQQPAIVLAYVLGVGLVGLHLSHGIGSSCQTLGVTNERVVEAVRRAGRLIAWALFLGYAAIPAAVLLGVVA